MEDDAMRKGANQDDLRLGRFVLDIPSQYVLRYGRLLNAQKFGTDAGSWRPALLILALGLVIITTLTYILHLGDGLVYILLLADGIIAALVRNRVFGN